MNTMISSTALKPRATMVLNITKLSMLIFIEEAMMCTMKKAITMLTTQSMALIIKWNTETINTDFMAYTTFIQVSTTGTLPMTTTV